MAANIPLEVACEIENSENLPHCLHCTQDRMDTTQLGSAKHGIAYAVRKTKKNTALGESENQSDMPRTLGPLYNLLVVASRSHRVDVDHGVRRGLR